MVKSGLFRTQLLCEDLRLCRCGGSNPGPSNENLCVYRFIRFYIPANIWGCRKLPSTSLFYVQTNVCRGSIWLLLFMVCNQPVRESGYCLHLWIEGNYFAF